MLDYIIFNSGACDFVLQHKDYVSMNYRVLSYRSPYSIPLKMRKEIPFNFSDQDGFFEKTVCFAEEKS